jgi:hypothetical protein
MIGGMGETLDYARGAAPPDVLASLDWLAQEGFVLADEQGGRDAPFGNLILVFERSSLAIRVDRDRSQWSFDVAAGDGKFMMLSDLLTAWQGRAMPEPGRHFEGPPPRVIPVGVEWRAVLPGLVSWLESGDRTREIGAATAARKEAVMRWARSNQSGDRTRDIGAASAARREAMVRLARSRRRKTQRPDPGS